MPAKNHHSLHLNTTITKNNGYANNNNTNTYSFNVKTNLTQNTFKIMSINAKSHKDILKSGDYYNFIFVIKNSHGLV